jgi:hypothetical protein
LFDHGPEPALGQPQVLFVPPPLGDINGDTDHVQRLAAFISHRLPARDEPPDFTCIVNDSKLDPVINAMP